MPTPTQICTGATLRALADTAVRQPHLIEFVESAFKGSLLIVHMLDGVAYQKTDSLSFPSQKTLFTYIQHFDSVHVCWLSLHE